MTTIVTSMELKLLDVNFSRPLGEETLKKCGRICPSLHTMDVSKARDTDWQPLMEPRVGRSAF